MVNVTKSLLSPQPHNICVSGEYSRLKATNVNWSRFRWRVNKQSQVIAWTKLLTLGAVSSQHAFCVHSIYFTAFNRKNTLGHECFFVATLRLLQVEICSTLITAHYLSMSQCHTLTNQNPRKGRTYVTSNNTTGNVVAMTLKVFLAVADNPVFHDFTMEQYHILLRRRHGGMWLRL